MKDLQALRRGIFLLTCSLVMVSGVAGCGNSTGNNIALDPQGFSGQVAAITDSPVTLFEARRDAVAANVVGSGLRDINWDGGAVTALIPGNSSGQFPPDLFINGGGIRQIFFGGGDGEIPIVSQDSFATINTGTGFLTNPSTLSGGITDLDPFTDTVNITTAASNTLTVNFTLQGATTTAGLVHGFGVIFQDVEIGAKSGLRFFDAAGNEIHQIFAQPLATGADQFVGAIFANPVVAQVIIDMGDNDQFGTDNEDIAGGVDFVAVDDLRFFLSDTVMPVTEFVSQVTDIADPIVARFELARRPLAQGQDQNINWDGGAVTVLTQGATATINSDIFLIGAGNRQLIIGGPNEDIRVSENRFATLDAAADNPSEPGSSATAGADFAALTSNVNFTVMGGEVATQTFFLADQTTPALIHGFAVIFTDVEVANQSGLRFLDANGQVIRTVFAQVQASGTHQLVGALFPSAQVAQVQVLFGDADSSNVADSGNKDFGTGPAGVGVGVVEDLITGSDHVVVDNFLFFKSTVPAN